MSYILSSTPNASGRIGYKNLFTTSGVTVTASSDQTNYEKENAIDWKRYDWWKPTTTGTHWIRASFASAKDADYMAISGHNLHEVGGSVRPQYSTDGGSSWSYAAAAVAPTTDKTIFVEFTSVNAADWRIEVITTTGQSLIGVASIGEMMELQTGFKSGFEPPTLARDHKYYTSVSEGGVFIGRSLRQITYSTSINLSMLTPEWVRTTWTDFLDHAQTKPFFFSWDTENHSDEAVFAWVNNSIPKPSYSSNIRMSVSLPIECSP